MTKNITTEVVAISPNMARELLATSEGNRSIKSAKVASYARDIKAGKWVLNGETIIISSKGVLLDGHHRLKACLVADTSFQAIICRGVDDKTSINTIDMGSSRNVQDVLHFNGYKDTKQIAAIVGVLMSLEAGRPHSANASSQEYLAYLNRYPFIPEAAHNIQKFRLHGVQTPCGAIDVIGHYSDLREEADDFIEIMKKGYNSRPGNPAHILREKIISDLMKDRDARMNKNTVHRLAFAAWNKHVKGEYVTVLRASAKFDAIGWPPKKDR